MSASLLFHIGKFHNFWVCQYNINIYKEDPIFEFFLFSIFSDNELIKKRQKTYFKTSVKTAKKRLDICGFNYKKAESVFFSDMCKFKDNYLKEYPEKTNEINKYFSKISLKKWFSKFKKNFHKALSKKSVDFDKFDFLDVFINCELDDYNYECDFQYEFGSTVISLIKIRAIMEFSDESESIILDLTDLVKSGWLDLCNIPSIPNKYLLVTEGKSDKEFIELSMKILYPDCSHLYLFFDHCLVNAEDGCSGLFNMVKFSITAAITNSVIFLFDNDKAGNEEVEKIKRIKNKIPENIRIIKLPSLNFCKSYPVKMSENEIHSIDINGTGCAIEFFLGESNISDSKGYFSINETGKKHHYKFEKSSKQKIHENFKKTLELGNIDDNNFKEMKILCEHIFRAFQLDETFII